MKYRPFIYALVLAILPASAAQSQTNPSIVESQGFLNLGEAKERRLGPDTTHVWLMNLEAGQYAVVEVVQKGIDVVVRLIDPNKIIKGEFNTTSTSGTEQAVCIADITGTWETEIITNKAIKFGSYSIKWAILRKTTEVDRQIVQADSLSNLAEKYFVESKYAEAVSCMSHALSIREKILGDEHLDVAKTLNKLGLLYFNQGKYTEAEPLLKRALTIREKVLGPNHTEVAKVLNDLALLYDYQGKFAEAEPLFKRSLAIRETVLGPDHTDVAQSLNDLAAFYDYTGKYVLAEPLYKRALVIREKVFGKNHAEVARVLYNLAYHQFVQGRYAEAEPLMQRTLSIREKTLGPDHPSVANSLDDLAQLYRSQDKYPEAVTFYMRSFRIREKVLGASHKNVAVSLNNLGEFYFVTGRYSEAEQFLQSSLKVYEKALGPNHPEVAMALNNLGSLYLTIGNYNAAESFLKSSLTIREQKFGPNHPVVSMSLNNLAKIHLAQKKYNEAEAFYKRAIEIIEKSFGSNHPNLGIALNNLAMLYSEQGNSFDSELLFKRALAINETALGPNHVQVAIVLRNLALLYKNQSNYTDAELLLKRAILVVDETVGYPDLRVEVYALQGQVRRQLANRAGAISDLSEALRSAENLRPMIGGGEETRAGFLDKYAEYFDDLVVWQIEDGQMEKALEYVERGRARTLLDQLAVAQVDLLNSIQEGNIRIRLANRQSDAKARMAEYQQRRNVLASRKDLSVEEKNRQGAALKDSLELATKEYEQVWEEIKLASPLWQNLMTSGGQPVALATVQQKLIPEKSLMLLYQIGKGQSHLFVIPPGAQKPEAIPLQFTTEDTSILQVKAGPLTSTALKKILVGSDSVSATLGVFSYLKTSPNLLKAGQEKSATAKLQALRRVLVPDTLWAKLAAYSEVIIIPDGLLHQLPFEALVAQNGDTPQETRYWIDEGPVIRYAPSATILDNLEKRTIAPSQTSVGKPSILSLSNPIFDVAIVEAESKKRLAGKPTVVVNDSASTQPADILEELMTASRGNEIELAGTLPRLPGTAIETDYVRKHFGVKNVKVLQGLQADEPNLRANIQGKRYLHFATHGLVELEHSSLSNSLALTLPPKDTVDSHNDGFLKLYEIYELQLPDCELAVLSACDTQVGRLFEGEGVFALSRGFLAAGARRVVASHWQVKDLSTAELIGAFFRVIATAEKEGKPVDYAQALRDAKLKLRRDKNRRQWNSPYFWAPFIITGKR
jgi:CHAT domain-containing protein/tetratricopeptide (TPR) repeat protein